MSSEHVAELSNEMERLNFEDLGLSVGEKAKFLYGGFVVPCAITRDNLGYEVEGRPAEAVELYIKKHGEPHEQKYALPQTIMVRYGGDPALGSTIKVDCTAIYLDLSLTNEMRNCERFRWSADSVTLEVISSEKLFEVEILNDLISDRLVLVAKSEFVYDN